MKIEVKNNTTGEVEVIEVPDIILPEVINETE